MNFPQVSIVMAVFNGERFLGEAVDSVLGQSFQDFEFIIIDDGSTDGTSAMLEAYGRHDDRIHVYRQENRGLVDSLNRGCALAQGLYLARMDCDDIAATDRFERQVQFLEAHPEVGLLSGAVEFIDATCKPLCIASNPCNDADIQRALPDGNVFWHPAAIMRKSVFQAVGGYRQIKDAEDYDLWLRMAEHTRTANLPEVLLHYRVHAGQVSIRKCEQQALGTMMAKVASEFRRAGKLDPFDATLEITPRLLEALGVKASEMQTTMARGYLSCARNLYRVGEYAVALEILKVLHSPELQSAERWVLADSFLWESLVCRRQKQILNSLVCAGRAITIRPELLGRPLKSAVGRLRARRA